MQAQRSEGGRNKRCGLKPALCAALGAAMISSSAAANLAYVSTYTNGALYVIDTASNTVLDVISDVGNGAVAITADGLFVYVTNQAPSRVSLLDTQTRALTNRVPLNGRPYRLAMTPDGGRAYITQAFIQPLAFVSTSTLEVTDTSFRPRRGTLEAIAIAPDGNRGFVSDGRGAVTVFDTSSHDIVADIGPDEGFFDQVDGIILSPDGAVLYVGDTYLGLLSAIDTARNRAQWSLPMPLDSSSVQMVPSSDGTRLYLTARRSVLVFDTTLRRIETSVTLEDNPFALAITPSGDRLYVTMPSSGVVAVVDTASSSVIGAISLEAGASWIAIAS